MLGVATLHQHVSGQVTAAGASCHLLQQLAHALGSAEVCAEQTAIGILNHHEGYLGQVVSLGQHLCTQQQTGLTVAGGLQQFVQGLFAGGGVAVHAHHRKLIEGVGKEVLTALSAGAQRIQVAAVALRAAVHLAHAVVAMVAAQVTLAPV